MNYLIVEDGIITNSIVADEAFAAEIGAVPAYEGARIGEAYSPPLPPPTVEDDLLENIAGQLTEQGAALADVMAALAELAGLVAEGSGTNG